MSGSLRYNIDPLNLYSDQQIIEILVELDYIKDNNNESIINLLNSTVYLI